MVLNDLVDAYLRERQGLGHITKDTAAGRRIQLNLMVNALPTANPNEVSVQMLREWCMTSSEGGPLKPSSVALRTTIAKHFFQWCADNDHVVKSPGRTLEAPKVKHGEPRFLETAEIRRLCAVITSPRDLAMVLLMAQAGCRRVEVHRALVSDLDMHSARIGLRGKGFGGEVSRTIPLPAELAEVLHVWLARKPESTYLFCTRQSDQISLSLISRIVTGYMRDAGVKKRSGDNRSTHSLRHTFAQQLADGDVNPRIIQAALGHNSITTTEKYIRRRVDVMAEALEGRRYLTTGTAA